MKLIELKKQLKKQLLVTGTVLVVAGTVTFGAYWWSSSLINEEKSLKLNVNQITGQISQSESEYGDLISSIDQYRNFDEKYKPTAEGFDKPSSRIRAARPIIEALKNKYRFGDMDVVFSNPQVIAPPANEPNLYTEVVNEIEIKFRALSDELVFAFIHDLISNFTGYISLNMLEIRRIRTPNASVFSVLEQSNEFIPLVKGKMQIKWTTLKGQPVAIKVEEIELLNNQSGDAP